MISRRRSGNELEAQQIAVWPPLRPNHSRVLDRRMVRRRSNPQGANVVDRDPHVDGNPKAANARIERQARTSHRRQELDLGVESPPTKLPPSATMDGSVGATLR